MGDHHSSRWAIFAIAFLFVLALGAEGQVGPATLQFYIWIGSYDRFAVTYPAMQPLFWQSLSGGFLYSAYRSHLVNRSTLSNCQHAEGGSLPGTVHGKHPSEWM